MLFQLLQLLNLVLNGLAAVCIYRVNCRFYLDLEKQRFSQVHIGLMGTIKLLFQRLGESEKQVDGCVFPVLNSNLLLLLLNLVCFTYFEPLYVILIL